MTLLKKILFSLILLVFHPLINSTTVNQCDDGSLLPNTTTIAIKSQKCSASPCPVILGCPLSIQLDFRAPSYLEHIQPDVIATYAGVSLDYPLNQDDACVGITNTQCPLVQGERVIYGYAMNLAPIFPEVTVNLEFRILDKDTNGTVVCSSFAVSVEKTDCPDN